ncbi:hypothetical protein CEUSTIGMA_g7532.t1 [Chlamydomonas eustigma]|uniref:DNA polymerase alpha/delta/epsilon subunit B domain-containing protein n=1 Tax=Chlamydomonas eustigma TaxID=1157962 RepID=A0A250XAK9_9CHLO|nr:hypothetical protein CEUSTIGMA_g7532.t1 [Chlamydomonas eustigma]|eukprot:GAX80094.1 hypothetical protein CEUSTIGMA_g7532.t1 [Chlamydomonas eustigma]
MATTMRDQAEAAWPGVPFAKILEIGSLPEGHEVAAIGTLFKDMKLKPSIMDEYTKDRGMKHALGAGCNFCSDSDGLVLEDEGGRMSLKGTCLPVHELVTGVVMAVRGQTEPGGDFIVSDICFMGLPPQSPLPSPPPEDKYVALISGLGLGKPSADLLKVQLAVDFLTGHLGSNAEQVLASKIVRLVVAGGTVGSMEALATSGAYSRLQAASLHPIKNMDMVLMELAAGLPVDLMPGAEDPTNIALPQQPLHRCLFPAAAGYGSFNRVTNPHHFEVDGVSFLGTSGQNIDDLSKYSRHSDRMSMMEACLTWRHLAPTAPDSLTCYPFHDRDPFILEHCPHVLFVGNQPEFKVSRVTGKEGQEVRMISVPSFYRTPLMVLVNLRTLDCTPMRFQGFAGKDDMED